MFHRNRHALLAAALLLGAGPALAQGTPAVQPPRPAHAGQPAAAVPAQPGATVVPRTGQAQPSQALPGQVQAPARPALPAGQTGTVTPAPTAPRTN